MQPGLVRFVPLVGTYLHKLCTYKSTYVSSCVRCGLVGHFSVVSSCLVLVGSCVACAFTGAASCLLYDADDCLDPVVLIGCADLQLYSCLRTAEERDFGYVETATHHLSSRVCVLV
jgi:hypothetical protein